MLRICTRPRFKKTRGLILYSLLILLILSCGGPRAFVVPKPLPDDRRPIPEPEGREINIIGNNIDKLLTMQISKLFKFYRHVRKISNNPKQAFNVNAFGEVPNSSWFTNRNGLRRMTLEEIARGPNAGNEPDTSGTWEIVRAKAEGVTPGFTIEDRLGERYVIKFDPVGYCELATGAEVVSTKFIYAAGYNTPENYIVYFHPGILKMGEKVKFTDTKGRKRFMTETDLQELLDRIEYLPDGRIRAVASKYLAGKIKGPFRYKSTVDDDPNDFIPHQHRRELRGLRVIAAWLNHFDTKAPNSLDVYVKEGYVKHYLIDFGSTLGSEGDAPMPPHTGFQGTFDLFQVFSRIATFGLHVLPWEKVEPVRYPSIGRFHSRHFNPQDYKFILPNPAFQRLTGLDGYWGAKLVTSFTDEQIAAAVAQGQYSDPEAEAYLLRTLIERRDIVGQYWFNRMPPLDNFHLRRRSGGSLELCFLDLAVETGLELVDEAQYRYRLNLLPKGLVISEYQNIGNSTCVQIPSEDEIAARLPLKPSSFPSEWQLEVTFQLRRGPEDGWSKWVKAYLRLADTEDEYSLLGITRQE